MKHRLMIRKLAILLAASIAAASCHCHDPSEEHGHDHDQGHATKDPRPALSFTHWTDQTELFMELRALVVGQDSACAAHVTKVEPFAALASGSVTVLLRGSSGEERFESSAPSQPGIFRPVARPAASGQRRLIVEVRSEGLTSQHDLGDVTVYSTIEAAREAIPEEPEIPGRITFLKEQQWPIELGTVIAQERPLRQMLRVPGTIRARSDGDVVVTAPAAGRVATNGGEFPRLGARVAVGDLLGRLAPRLEAADLASLELAVTSAQLEVRFAEREKVRLEGLRGEGAVPERRVEDAAHVAEESRAALATAQKRLEQFRRVQRTAGGNEGSVQLRAPLSGSVTEIQTAPGAFVEAGAPLFRVTDVTQLWLEARVPESDAGQLASIRGASLVLEGSDDALELPADSLVGRGHLVDPVSRTLPVLFAVDNSSGRFAVGAFARAFLVQGEERRVLTVPESSLVDDGGITVAFVQVAGEAFERRVVRVGARDRGSVEVLAGIAAGERVVSRGAWSVKLAASSGAIPAHGHSH
jgi:cobalt-zinc-cadmium efflux system membrane fusion protein